MNSIFEQAYSLRASDFDRWARLRPGAIMELFQDGAGRHALELGVGTEALLEKNMAWVLVKHRFRILRETRMYQPVTVRTWPLSPNRVDYRREYQILDGDGQIIAEGSSVWVLMDLVSRKIVLAGDIYPLAQYCGKQIFPGRFPRLRAFEAQGEPYGCLPPYSALDMNGHVNNAKYPGFALDANPPEKGLILREMQIEYHREVLPGEELLIFSRREGSALLARGENREGDKMFSLSMDFEEAAE